MCLCVAQLVQLISAVDPDEPAEGHHFYFSMVPDRNINPNFTLRDNQGYALKCISFTRAVGGGIYGRRARACPGRGQCLWGLAPN